MEFSIFHSYSPEILLHQRNKIKIWTPNTKDLNNIIHQIIENYVKVNINVERTENIDLDNFSNTKGCEIKLFDPPPSKLTTKKITKIWLYAQSDTLAQSLYNISQQLINISICFIVPKIYQENADIFLKNKSIGFEVFSASLLIKEKPDLVLLLNDWSKEPLRLISLCRIFNIPTVCIQESIIDFGDRYRRMQHADYAFIQGTQTVFELKRDLFFLTGNPRYETIKKASPDNEKLAVLNCNFTYNINENIREQWLDDIIELMDKQNYDYLISQHPRDNGNLLKYLNVYKSNSSSVHQLLEKASLLITRFSSLIHEAIIMGIPVIYYNPHQEKMQYNFNFNNEFLFEARNKDELEKCILKIKNGANFSNRDEYLSRHCILPNSLPSKTISELVTLFPFRSQQPKFIDYLYLVIFHSLIQKIVFLVRKLFK